MNYENLNILLLNLFSPQIKKTSTSFFHQVNEDLTVPSYYNNRNSGPGDKEPPGCKVPNFHLLRSIKSSTKDLPLTLRRTILINTSYDETIN